MAKASLNYKELPISERIQLVEDIWDSIAEETPVVLSAEDRSELHRRHAAHQADPSSSLDWDRIRIELFKGRG
ncbi:addiction module protein [Dokdonella ginsengisoli]|uniref:Addiction module protein n=1 Tax=Dokdonella ginsengisoli TaxID=363846 RepID=A0ABV9QR62_9GAMM